MSGPDKAATEKIDMSSTPPAPHGRFCREIRVVVEPGRAVGELIDDFHHFRAEIEHDEERVTRVTGEAPRIPWQTCGGAVNPVAQLGGHLLRRTMREVARLSPARTQCTHLYDAACVAVARAARGVGSVVYRAIVPDRIDGKTLATLHRDGTPLLAWDLDGYRITGPAPFSEQVLIGGHFADWAEEAFDTEDAEAVLILNRACIIASGRSMDLDDAPRAVDVPGTRLGVCHTYSEAEGPKSFRVVGSARRIADADDAHRASLQPTDGEVQYFRRRS